MHERAPRPGGAFGGRWLSSNGRLSGHVFGRHEVNAAGEQTFGGRIIEHNSHFAGRLAGTWAGGTFERRWHLRGDARHRAVSGAGPLRREWVEDCGRPRHRASTRAATPRHARR